MRNDYWSNTEIFAMLLLKACSNAGISEQLFMDETFSLIIFESIVCLPKTLLFALEKHCKTKNTSYAESTEILG